MAENNTQDNAASTGAVTNVPGSVRPEKSRKGL
ncbi:hypothetical protein FB461_1711 [Rarobacter faecitabidus]|uniref:Uncharacterized protein n=1 Tax=Rarobacter faecitabidus TaxID=13243 RepID=A0A542ZP35_RARFA|nr:hypothetical protein FB461_1711 [Rarobacter faecitabidus]